MKLLTLNCRGLNGQLKRHLYFSTFLKHDIICLQETYITAKNVELWKSEWEGDFFYCFGTSNSKGQIILINKRFSCEESSDLQIDDRCIGISFFASEKKFVIFNVYVPSVRGERVNYLHALTDKLKKLKLSNDTHLILCGDMNMVLDNHLDVISGDLHPNREIIAFSKFLNEFKLTDCWRLKHAAERDFSWSRHNPFIARRLDYCLCSKNLKPLTIQSTLQQFSFTDHKAVTSIFNIEDFPRGPGKWYFNDLLLDDSEYDLFMKKHLNDYYLTLLAQNYSQNEIYDLLKISIRDESKAFSRNKKANLIEQATWDTKIQELNKKLIANPDDKDSLSSLRNMINKKEIFEIAQAKGAIKRSRAKFIESGEKNTKYFLNLEKSRQSKKIIRAVKCKNGQILIKPNEILSELRTFSKDLMTATDNDDFNDVYSKLETFMGDIPHPILSESDKQFLEAPLTIEEFESALKGLNSDSSPGEDGLTPAFYSHFWKYLKKPFFESLMESIRNKKLTVTQRRALISLLYKGKEYDIQEIASWRPISLKNTDYKIYSKVLATRVQTIIKNIISGNQVAYIKGRSIAEHIRTIDDIINITNVHNLPGILLSLDFKKAFDTISKASILAALKKFNFGPVFISYVETILNDTEAAIKNGGWTSEFFSTTRGVPQGCCLSPLLFIIVVEFLAIKIRHCPQISGVLENHSNFSKKDSKLLQYADDMNLFLKTTQCIAKTLEITDEFETFTGLSLNRKKSIGMGLGQNKGLIDEEVGITWKKHGESMRVLGVFFNASVEASLLEQNWKPKLVEMQKTINTWTRRNLTILGKCIIAKTFLLSKIAYIIQSLCLPDNVLNEFDTLLFRFLWKNKNFNNRAYEKIKRSILCLNSSEGGINMISVKDQQQVMLIRWIQKGSLTLNPTHKRIIDNIFKNVGGIQYIIHTFSTSDKSKGIDMVPSLFWRKAINAWLNINNKNEKLQHNIPIFNNSDILYKGKTLFIARWLKKNCKYVHDITRNGTIKPLNEVKLMVGNYGGLVPDYFAVYNAIQRSNLNLNPPQSCANLPQEFKMDNKTLRTKIVKQKNNTMVAIDFWKRKYNVDINDHFLIAINATKETKLRYLHFRFIHNIFPTNILLKKMYLKSSNVCDLCDDIDFIDHAFYNCRSVKKLWDDISTIISTNLNIQFKITASQALLGIPRGVLLLTPPQLKEVNHMILIGKLSISKSKVSKNRNIKIIFEQEVEIRKSSFHFIKC